MCILTSPHSRTHSHSHSHSHSCFHPQSHFPSEFYFDSFSLSISGLLLVCTLLTQLLESFASRHLFCSSLQTSVLHYDSHKHFKFSSPLAYKLRLPFLSIITVTQFFVPVTSANTTYLQYPMRHDHLFMT